jgi:hypothetical protein
MTEKNVSPLSGNALIIRWTHSGAGLPNTHNNNIDPNDETIP